MKSYIMFRYVSWLYLRYFFLIAFALALFFAGLDYMQNGSRLSGFNIKILYLFYKGSYALDLLFPIALILSMIITKIALVRSNAIVGFYSLGYSKKEVLKPFIFVSTVLTILYVLLHFTTFINYEQQAKALLDKKRSQNITSDIFVKYDDSFIYISKLIPALKEAKDIRIYRMNRDGLYRIIYGDRARFDGEKWLIKSAKVITKPTAEGLSKNGLEIEIKDIQTLQGFKPKILTSVFEGKKLYTIQDAYHALLLLIEQGLDTSKVRSIFYYMTVTPFFALFLIVVFFLNIPPHARSANLLWVSFTLVGIALFVWGVIYLLFRVSLTGVVIPEFSLLLPIIFLGLFALYSYVFKTNL